MQKIVISYEPQEMQVLTELINMAVKAGGLPVANAALVLHNKHVAALEEAQQTSNVVELSPKEE